jgi:hypothetical protein
MLFIVTNPYNSAKQFADKKSVIRNNQQNEARCNFTETRLFNHDTEQKIILRNKTMLQKYCYDSQCITYVIRPYMK